MNVVYRIYSQNKNYKTISYDKTPLMRIIGSELWGDYSEIETFKYKWVEDANEKIVCDSPFLMGAIPIFGESVVLGVKNFLSPALVDVLPIEVEGERYCILKAKILLDNILNLRRSKIVKFSDGRIMKVEKYVFNQQNNIPLIFKIRQYPLFTFITDSLALSLEMLHPTGLAMEKIDTTAGWNLF